MSKVVSPEETKVKIDRKLLFNIVLLRKQMKGQALLLDKARKLKRKSSNSKLQLLETYDITHCQGS